MVSATPSAMAISICQTAIWPRSFHPARLIEPFAGGGIVSLTAAAENLTEYVTMVEIDDDVASVWQTLLQGEDWSWVTQQIGNLTLLMRTLKLF